MGEGERETLNNTFRKYWVKGEWQQLIIAVKKCFVNEE